MNPPTPKSRLQAPMLGVLTSTTAEARRQSAGLKGEGRAHRLFGTQALEFRGERVSRGSGRFSAITYFEDDGEISPDFVAKLRESRVGEVVNAGTLNSWLYSLVCRPKYAFDIHMNGELPRPNFPGRNDMVDLILSLEQCPTITTRRLAAVRRGPVGPDPGWSACESPPVPEVLIVEAVERAAQRTAAAVAERTAAGVRGLERVAHTCVYENGTIVKVDPRTDPCIDEMRPLRRPGTLRLLVKLWQPRQTPLDPPAIGPKTIEGAKAAGFTAIVMPRDGLIFDRTETLAFAARSSLPIFGL